MVREEMSISTVTAAPAAVPSTMACVESVTEQVEEEIFMIFEGLDSACADGVLTASTPDEERAIATEVAGHHTNAPRVQAEGAKGTMSNDAIGTA